MRMSSFTKNDRMEKFESSISIALIMLISTCKNVKPTETFDFKILTRKAPLLMRWNNQSWFLHFRNDSFGCMRYNFVCSWQFPCFTRVFKPMLYAFFSYKNNQPQFLATFQTNILIQFKHYFKLILDGSFVVIFNRK